MKRIYFETGWKPHSINKGIASNPPEGYECILPSPLKEGIGEAARTRILGFLLDRISRVLPLNLIRARLQSFEKIPSDVDLIYSSGFLVFRKRHWVMDFDYIPYLIGHNLKHFRRYRRIIERAFASEYCKKVICWTEAAKKMVLCNLDCSGFEHKLEVVPFTVPERNFTKSYGSEKIKLLFVNSSNIPMQFHYKGGKEVLEAFMMLSSKYDNLELVVRSDLPQDLMSKYRGSKNLTIMDKVVPWELLEREFKSTDIFLYPTHSSHDLVVLDAMSYELPVVITDVVANSEIVEDGRTGFVIKKSEKVPYYVDNFIPAGGTPQFEKAIRIVDPRVVEQVVEKTSILIENEELRRQMGKAGRWEIEEGKFSIQKRNEKLKRIFDEAIGAES